MIASRLLDLLLVLTLLVFIGEGIRNGIARSLGAILGVIAGGALAFIAIPLLAAWVPDPFWRVAVIVAVSVTLLFGWAAASGAASANGASRSASAADSRAVPPTASSRRSRSPSSRAG
jgi:hypothetical protein